jgi:hypothetical protein
MLETLNILGVFGGAYLMFVAILAGMHHPAPLPECPVGGLPFFGALGFTISILAIASICKLT